MFIDIIKSIIFNLIFLLLKFQKKEITIENDISIFYNDYTPLKFLISQKLNELHVNLNIKKKTKSIFIIKGISKDNFFIKDPILLKNCIPLLNSDEIKYYVFLNSDYIIIKFTHKNKLINLKEGNNFLFKIYTYETQENKNLKLDYNSCHEEEFCKNKNFKLDYDSYHEEEIKLKNIDIDFSINDRFINICRNNEEIIVEKETKNRNFNQVRKVPLIKNEFFSIKDDIDRKVSKNIYDFNNYL